jgi:2-oxoglutarate dehydrogenase complex dehydrogenase (E1) component-like enzyme
MYKGVQQHEDVAILYGNRLVIDGVVTAEELEAMKKGFWDQLDTAMKSADASKECKQ